MIDIMGEWSRQVEGNPEAYAIRTRTSGYTFGEIQGLISERMLALSQGGIHEGESVTSTFAPSMEGVVEMLAVISLGAVFVPKQAKGKKDEAIGGYVRDDWIDALPVAKGTSVMLTEDMSTSETIRRILGCLLNGGTVVIPLSDEEIYSGNVAEHDVNTPESREGICEVVKVFADATGKSFGFIMGKMEKGFREIEIDSLLFVQALVALEDKFGIEVSEDMMVLSGYDAISDFFEEVEALITKNQ